MDGALRPAGLRCHADCGDKTRPTGEESDWGVWSVARNRPTLRPLPRCGLCDERPARTYPDGSRSRQRARTGPSRRVAAGAGGWLRVLPPLRVRPLPRGTREPADSLSFHARSRLAAFGRFPESTP
jgi:hypothetical protein